jgi:hypothetical protein
MEDSGATMRVTFLRHGPYFDENEESRDIYRIVIKRGGEKMEFDFGQGIAHSLPPLKPCESPIGRKKRINPDAYSILACLTKYEPEGDVWEFAQEYGYEINSRESFNKVDRIHMAVINEYRDVMRLFGDVIDELQEIS